MIKIVSFDDINYFDLMPSGTTGVSLSVEKANFELPYTFEINRKFLLDSMHISAQSIGDPIICAQVFSDIILNILEDNSYGIPRNYTFDDGSIPLNMGVWHSKS